MVGAFTGAVSAALQVMFEDPAWAKTTVDDRRSRIKAATGTALRPWLARAGGAS
jgi:hypothetical protein